MGKSDFEQNERHKDTRDLLRNLHSLNKVSRTNIWLESRILKQDKFKQRDKLVALRDAATEALEQLEDTNKELYELLRKRYWIGERPGLIWTELKLPERTYYYRLSQGIRSLTDYLLEKENSLDDIGYDGSAPLIYKPDKVNGAEISVHPTQFEVKRTTSTVWDRPAKLPGQAKLLGRTNENESSLNHLKDEKAWCVELCGPAGIGKSHLLNDLVYDTEVEKSFSNGIINLWFNLPVNDVWRDVYNKFHQPTSDYPLRIHPADPLNFIKKQNILFTLDDQIENPGLLVGTRRLGRGQIEDGLIRPLGETGIAGETSIQFLIASREKRVRSYGKPIYLQGLPLEEALTLLKERVFAERDAVDHFMRGELEQLHKDCQGNPDLMMMAAERAINLGIPLVEATGQLKEEEAKRGLAVLGFASRSEAEKEILAKLAAVGGAPLLLEHLTDLLPDFDAALKPILNGLIDQRIIRLEKYGYRLPKHYVSAITEAVDSDHHAKQMLKYFTHYARENVDTPEKVLESIEPILEIYGWGLDNHLPLDVLNLAHAIDQPLTWSGYRDTKKWVLEQCLHAVDSLNNQPAIAWVEHQLGSWALCFGEMEAARIYLSTALKIRTELGDEAGAEVTQHNIDTLDAILTETESNHWSSRYIEFLRRQSVSVGLLAICIIACGLLSLFIWGLGPADEVNLIVYTSDRDGNRNIYTINDDRSGEARLTTNPANDESPAWSPSGSNIVFVSDRVGSKDIYRMKADGSNQQALTNHPYEDKDPDWSRKGEVVFASNRAGKYDIYVMEASGSEDNGALPKRLTDNLADDVSPTWSSKADKIAFVSNRNGNSDIYVMNGDGSGMFQVTNNPANDVSPAWSVDGNQITFVSDRQGDWKIFTINATETELSGGVSIPETNDNEDMSAPVWFPDETIKRIAFHTERNGTLDLYILEDGDDSPFRLTNHSANDWQPDWISCKCSQNAGIWVLLQKIIVERMQAGRAVGAAFQA